MTETPMNDCAYKYEWTLEGRKLLNDLEILIQSAGGKSMLAYHIILENPEYFRTFHTQRQASANLNGHFSRKRSAKRRWNVIEWSADELETIKNTMDMHWNEIKYLLPNRTQGAVYTRRCALRKLL